MTTRKKIIFSILGGLCGGLAIMAALSTAIVKTSSNNTCLSCHWHSDADASWKQGNHCLNNSGVMTDCAECHLPPQENTASYVFHKTRLGVKDLWSFIFKKKENIDWEAKKDMEYAVNIVFNESCVKCHANLYPQGISDDGIAAHLYYDEYAEKLDIHCISCHMDAGHFNPGYSHSKMVGVPVKEKGSSVLFTQAAKVDVFANFLETVPGTSSSIRMIAVPGGSFTMGSPENEAFRGEDEGPQHKVNISPFFMSETEITWDQFWTFYSETMSEGRTPPEVIYANNTRPDVDAVSGPTPPFGNPDQGWGMGDRPAITMTHYAAQTFCQWLSLKTGKTYRLPTEAEWEYAARAGSDTPYFFEGSPKKYSEKSLKSRIFGADTTCINRYAVYSGNSRKRSQEPSRVQANAFGLKNMLGNVMEYCSDWYAPDYYTEFEETNPKGPVSGTEHVVRGGAYSDDASGIRCAARAHTMHNQWLKTDPQNPKSIWWYSDIKGIGFRVVCETPEIYK